MGLLQDLQAKADVNGDGKIDAADLAALKDKYPDQAAQLDGLKSKADANGDGKLDFADAQNALGDLGNKAQDMMKDAGDMLNQAKDSFFKK